MPRDGLGKAMSERVGKMNDQYQKHDRWCRGLRMSLKSIHLKRIDCLFVRFDLFGTESSMVGLQLAQCTAQFCDCDFEATHVYYESVMSIKHVL